MFSGTFRPRLDDKGRLFLPAKFREAMGGGLVITRGQERSIDVRTKCRLRRVRREVPERLADRRSAPRPTGGCCSPLPPSRSLDKQGRITITPELRDYAALDRECVVIGIYDRIEIWEPQAWAAYTAAQESAFSDVQEEIFPGF